ncbi:MAG: phosphoglucosamine mutase [bacterium]|nr:phosphoglucosamine mutase [bacterium]
MAPLMVSVSGIRGIVGESLLPEVIIRYTAAYATWCRNQGDSRIVVIGRDGRPSGMMVLDLVKGTLAAAGFEAVDLGVCTTPGTAMAVPACNAIGGIVITASHNPAPWNALKFLDADGNFLSPANGEAVLAVEQTGDFAWQGHETLGSSRVWDGADRHHIDAILALSSVDRNAIATGKFKVVVDAVNSSGSEVLPNLLEILGCEVVRLYCDGTGIFPHVAEPKPENLGDLAVRVREEGADLGLALDPDSDRLVLVDETGTVLSEEFTLALVMDYFLARQPGPVAANMSSSRVLDDVAARHGQICHRSAVGEAHVVAAMVEHDAVIGGEGNGGVILPELHAGRDGLVGSALMLSSLATSGRKLSELAADLPVYVMEKRRVELQAKGDMDEIRALALEHFTGELDTRDGVKANSAEGWIHVRPSNTEAILRISGESNDAEWLKTELNRVEDIFRRHLG